MREELLAHLRAIKDYCKSIEWCTDCAIKKECFKLYLGQAPKDWEV